MDINQFLVNHYSNYDEDGRLTLKHGSVEFLTTMRYIERYIKHGDCVLEIGAATGRYSHTIARQGYTVDALELVDHNIEIFRKNTEDHENVTITQGNALNLSAFSDDKYDITLLLGPLYHLYCKEDKLKALREAIRVTKQGGVIFAAYVISDGTIIDDGFRRGIINVAEYIKKGMINPRTFATKSEAKDLFELLRKENIDELMSELPVTRLHYVASDGCARLIRDALYEMDDKTFELYLKYHFAICEREDMVGITSHVVDIFRKDASSPG